MSETDKIIDEVLGQLYPNKELPPKSHARKVLKPIAQDASMYRYFKRVAKEEFGQGSLGAIFVMAGEHTLRAAHASEQAVEPWKISGNGLNIFQGNRLLCTCQNAVQALQTVDAHEAALSQRPTPATAQPAHASEQGDLIKLAREIMHIVGYDEDDIYIIADQQVAPKIQGWLCSRPTPATEGKEGT